MRKQKTKLSPRQVEIIRCLALGKTRAQVAAELGISTHTLSAYLGRAFKFLGASNLVDAVLKTQQDRAEGLSQALRLAQSAPEGLRVSVDDGQLLLTFELSVRLPLGSISTDRAG